MKNITDNAVCTKELNKTYGNGFQALSNINLQIKRGEIFQMNQSDPLQLCLFL